MVPLIRLFEESVRQHGDEAFFRFADGGAAGQALRGPEVVVSYRQARLSAIALMHQLAREGARRGSFVASDMDNCPAFVYLLLACAYGGFRLVALNYRLTEAEKDERLASIEAESGNAPVLITEADVRDLVNLGRQAESRETLIHSAQRAAALATVADLDLVMFTSGTTGLPKAAQLPGESLCGSALAFNDWLGGGANTLWQVCLPLYHIGGFQTIIRSILNDTPFILYRRFEAARVLSDAQKYAATHISVVDKTLRDLLEWSQRGVHGGLSTLRAYRCILLGGSAPNEKTLEQARQLQAPVFASYGMTETSSAVAACAVDEGDGRDLHLLPGYSACVIDGDDYGRGQLGIKGPGMFCGYLGQEMLLTADGFFATGDTALVVGDTIRISERVEDMFVSGGENVYPEEIRRKLLDIPGVADAYVYGEADETWGRRPVALVEMEPSLVGPQNAVAVSRQVHTEARQRLARIYQPDRLFALAEFPRHGIGKIDRRALEQMAQRHLDIRRVELSLISQPLVRPIRTAKGLLSERESLIVEVFDAAGRSGIGEDVAFSTDWYLPETIPDDLAFLREQAIPRLLEDVYLHPREAYGSLAGCEQASRHRMALAALETALWDLYGKIAESSIRELIDANTEFVGWGPLPTSPSGMAPGGAVIGLMPIERAVETARSMYEQGYRRIKLKIVPGNAVERVRAVRQAVPEALIMLDANQSFTEAQLSELRQLDTLGCTGIEEPLDPRYPPKRKVSMFMRLANLQRLIQTTIYVDESIVTDDDMREALSNPGIRGYVIKIGKFGGISPALQFYRAVRARGARVWMGGMFETGVSKRLHAAFGLLPGVDLPGDISDTSLYFAADITEPPFVLEQGNLQVNPPEAPFGLGCSLNHEVLASLAKERWTFGADSD